MDGDERRDEQTNVAHGEEAKKAPTLPAQLAFHANNQSRAAASALRPDVRHAVIHAIEHVTAMSLSDVPIEFVPLHAPRRRDHTQALLDALLLLCQQLVHDLSEAERVEPVAVLQRVTAEVAGY